MERGFIIGDRESRRVWVDGEELKPHASLELANHSRGIFNWGYDEGAAAQLALAILLKFTDEPSRAIDLYHEFKWDFLIAEEELRIPIEKVKDWVRQKNEEYEVGLT